jgi:shikimate kinase
MRVHIVGLAGSGKSTLARWISLTCAAPAHDLDWVVYGDDGRERPASEISRRLEAIAREAAWVTEGAYHDDWLRTLLDAADLIVWLDLPLHRCVVRMVRRHALAELRRNNRHPGWRKLIRFLNYTRRTASYQRQDTGRLLLPYGGKLVQCRSARELRDLKAVLTSSPADR